MQCRARVRYRHNLAWGFGDPLSCAKRGRVKRRAGPRQPEGAAPSYDKHPE